MLADFRQSSARLLAEVCWHADEILLARQQTLPVLPLAKTQLYALYPVFCSSSSSKKVHTYCKLFVFFIVNYSTVVFMLKVTLAESAGVPAEFHQHASRLLLGLC